VDSEAMAYGRNGKTGISVSEMNDIVQVRGLSCGYSEDNTVLRNVDLSLPRNMLNMIVGR
jgi:ATP-binding cassette subfamily C (CFTR/MRP) protein 1